MKKTAEDLCKEQFEDLKQAKARAGRTDIPDFYEYCLKVKESTIKALEHQLQMWRDFEPKKSVVVKIKKKVLTEDK